MARLALILIFFFFVGPQPVTFGQSNSTEGTVVDSILENSNDFSAEQRIEIISALLDSLPVLSGDQKAKVYIELGLSYSRVNQFHSAISCYDKAISESLASNSNLLYSKALNLKGISQTRMHQHGKAIETFKNALEVREELGDKLLIASTLNNLAICFRATNQLDLALASYKRSYDLYKEVDDVLGQSFALNNMGLVFFNQDDYIGAVESFTKSLGLKAFVADTLIVATTYNSLGKVYHKINNYNLALESLKQAASHYSVAKNYYGLADSYNGIASVYLSMGRFAHVKEFLAKAEPLINFEENSNLALENLKLQSDYHQAVGNHIKSRDILAKYIQRYQEVQNNLVNNQIAELSFMYESDRLEKERNMLEMNLDIERLKVQKVRIQQYAITSFAALLFILLVASLLFIRRYIRKGAELEKVNAELNRVNSHLETIVDSRTQDLLETLKKAQESDKQKSAFLANMSHEIRTPLNGILGFSRLLTDDTLTQSERNEYVGLINRRGRNLLQIVNDIINISLIDSGEVKINNTSFNLNQLMYDLFNVFTSTDYDKKKPGVELKLNLSLNDSRSMIVSDPNRIEQVVSNIVDNAFKFTTSGEIEYGYTIEPNNTIKFFVRDTGPGIPPEKKELVFKRFNRTDEELARGYSATGLGLPICVGLVKLLNGRLWFETTVGEGTTFFFTIPFIPGKTESNSYISRSSVQSISFIGRVILVVEDDLISYQFIEALLKPTEAKILHAKNGEDAIEMVKIRTDIDLIVMDMRLPFIDGYEATAKIKSINPQMVVVAQTANAMSYDREKCISVGCNDYLPKPIDPDEFLMKIAYHLKKPAHA